MNNKIMNLACEYARHGMIKGEGGPFGAVIVDSEGRIVSTGNNQVLSTNDPTAHAEIVAIRNACKKLNTHDLSNLILYTSCEPCPMCLSAIIWANIKEIYYAATASDAASIGFRDSDIYDFIKGKNNMIKLNHIENQECVNLFEEYVKNNKEMY